MRTQACYVSDSLTGEFKGGDVLCDTMGYCGQGVAQGGIVDTPDHKWYVNFSGQRCCRQNPGSCASKMGEKCQSYLYAGAGRTQKSRS